MIISHSKKFIFIHNYKVAGSSVTEALSEYDTRNLAKKSSMEKLYYKLGIYPKVFSGQFHFHSSAKSLQSQLPAKIFNNYFKFGFVRNPWDWQVSLYNYARKWEQHHQRELMLSMNFEQYIEWRVNNEIRLQKEFFYDESNRCLVDFVGKLENLHSDFKTICNKIGISTELPHVNISSTGKSYLEYYSPRLIDMVYEAYKDDIELFGYSKPKLH